MRIFDFTRYGREGTNEPKDLYQPTTRVRIVLSVQPVLRIVSDAALGKDIGLDMSRCP